MYNGPMSGYPDMALTAFGDKSAVGFNYPAMVLSGDHSSNSRGSAVSLGKNQKTKLKHRRQLSM